MKRLITIAVATIAMIPSAWAASSCKKAGDARPHCYLHVDGRTVTDGACIITIAHDGQEYDIYDLHSGTEVLVVMNPNESGRPLYGFWNRGSKSDIAPMINFGRVKMDNEKDFNTTCFRNNRFQMCITAQPIFICN
jgi:hypothetical protein